MTATTRWAPHVTVATLVADEANRLLMVQELQNGRSVLNQPAGHLEPNESLQQAAIRETLEESGWEIELTHLVGIYQWRAPDGTDFMRIAFAARPLRHHPERKLDSGIETTHWLSPEQVLKADNLRGSPVASCVRDWLAGARHPLSLLEMIHE